MKQVDEMPTSGQFVAVLELYGSKITSETLMWDDCGSLIVIMPDGYHEEVDADFYVKLEAKYFIAD